MNKLIAYCLTLLLISACSTQAPKIQDSAPTAPPKNLSAIPDAIPKVEAKSRGGNATSYQVFGKTYYVKPNSLGFTQKGKASWYGTKFHGRKTSNGETYNMYAMSAAHKTLPIPTYLKVTNLSNQKQIIVRVNDRGPFHGNRIIDLSYAAAHKLDILGHGTANVEIEAINPRKQVTEPKTLATLVLQKERTIKKEPIAKKATDSSNSFYLQVGAFSDEANAQNLKSKLLNKSASITNININKSQESALYRVHIGPYSTLEEADKARILLRQSGITNTHYMQY